MMDLFLLFAEVLSLPLRKWAQCHLRLLPSRPQRPLLDLEPRWTMLLWCRPLMPPRAPLQMLQFVSTNSCFWNFKEFGEDKQNLKRLAKEGNILGTRHMRYTFLNMLYTDSWPRVYPTMFTLDKYGGASSACSFATVFLEHHLLQLEEAWCVLYVESENSCRIFCSLNMGF